MRLGTLNEPRVGQTSTTPGERVRYPFALTVVACLYSAWVLSPYVSRNVNPRYLIAIVVLWGAVALVALVATKQMMRVRVPLVAPWTCALLLWFTFSYLRVSDSVAVGNYWSTCLYVFPVFIAMFLIATRSRRSKLGFLIFVAVCVTLTSASSIVILHSDPYAGRYLTGSISVAVESYSTSNLATVQWVMATVVLIPVILGLKGMVKSPAVVFLLNVSVLVNTLHVLMAGSAIAAFVTFALFLYIFSDAIRANPIRSFAVAGAAIVAAAALVLSAPSSSMSLNSETASHYGGRLGEIRDLWGAGDSGGSFAARIQDGELGVVSLLENPILGVGMVHGDPGKDRNLGVGMHSQVLDDLARYGLIGAMMLFFVYRELIRDSLGQITRDARRYVLAGLGSAGCLSVLNPTAFPGFGLALFACIPILASLGREADLK